MPFILTKEKNEGNIPFIFMKDEKCVKYAIVVEIEKNVKK